MSELLISPATAVAEPLADALQLEPAAAPDTLLFTGNETSGQINDKLFGGAPAAPEWPDRIWEHREETKFEGMVSMKPLADEISAESLATIAAMREQGIETKPRFAIVMGNPWGEKEEHLKKVALDVFEKGVAAPFGDGPSYVKSLLRQCAAVGVQPVLYLGEELRNHPAVLAALEKYGLDPEETLPSGHNLGILYDLSLLYSAEQSAIASMAEYQRIRQELLAASVGQESNTAVQKELEQLDEAIEHAEITAAGYRDVITDRRQAEDYKIGALIRAASEDPTIDGVIAITNTFDRDTQKLLGEYFTKHEKAVDGQSTRVDRADRRWNEATSEAVVRCAEYMFRKIGRDIRDIPKQLKRLFGMGPRVGLGVSELHEMGYIYGNTSEVTEGAANPGLQEAALVIGAVPVARILKANLFKTARVGVRSLFGRRARKLVMVDAGVSTVFPEDGSAPYTQSNLDPDSIPNDGSVIATNDVGKVTSAVIVNRVVQQWTERVKKLLASPEKPNESRTRQLGEHALVAAGA